MYVCNNNKKGYQLENGGVGGTGGLKSSEPRRERRRKERVLPVSLPRSSGL